MKSLYFSLLFFFSSFFCYAQSERAALYLYVVEQTVLPTDLNTLKTTGQKIVYLDSHTSFLPIELVINGDTLNLKTDGLGYCEIQDINSGKVELVIKNRPNLKEIYKPYSEQLDILPGDNIVFAEMKLLGESRNPLLSLINVSSDDIKTHPMPVSLEEDGLHYALDPLVFESSRSKGYNRLMSFPGITIKDREIILSGKGTAFSRVNDTLIFNHSQRGRHPLPSNE